MEPSSQRDQAAKGEWQKFLPERPLRVLLVEDDTATRQVVSALLGKCGYEVSPVADGLKAWDLMEHSDNPCDLVLADATMPLFSGTDLLAKIMKSEAHKDIPVIMMSSHDSLDVVFKCLLRGAKDFLVKPLRKNELRNLWQHVWRKNHASRSIGGGSGAIGKKRKATRMSDSGDISGLSKDNALSSRDKKARSGSSETGTETQSFWNAPPPAERMMVKPPEKQTVLEQGNLLHTPGREQLQMQGEMLQEGVNIDRQLCGAKDYGGQMTKSIQNVDALSVSEGSEASERLAKAIDLIGTMMGESTWADEWKGEGEGLMFKMSEGSLRNPSLCSPPRFPTLELSLKRMNWNDDGQCETDAKNGVKQSDCSAFSRYSSSALVQQQPCIPGSASLPTDHWSLAGGFSGISASSGDSVGSGNIPTNICAKPNERPAGNGSCGPSTLHFPRAVSFKHGRQDGSSALSFLASHNDYHGITVEEKSMSSLRSAPLDSATASNSPIFSEAPSYGNCQAGIYAVQKKSNTRSVLCSKQPELAEKEACKHPDNHVKHRSLLHSHLHAQSLVLRAASDQQQEALPQNVTVCMSDAGTHQNEKSATVCEGAAKVKGSLNDCGSGSNSGSNEGSNYYANNQNRPNGNSVLTQDGCSFEDFINTDENSAADCSELASHGRCPVNCTMLLPDCCRTTLRQAALDKFRQKRKVRCFEKKVRYQSRKKLAEQRPRVKGQFVRQAVYDASLVNHCKLEEDVVCT